MNFKYGLLSVLTYAARGSSIIATVTTTGHTEAGFPTTPPSATTPVPYRNALDFQSRYIAALSNTDALPSSRITTIASKTGTGEFITVANPFLHAKYLFAASLLGSSGGLSSYVVEPTISVVRQNYPHPKETITVGPSTFIGILAYTAPTLPGAPTYYGPQSGDTQSASCTINSGSTAVCSYGYLAKDGGTTPLRMRNSPPITLTAAQFNTLEVLQGSVATGAVEITTSTSLTLTRSSQGMSMTGSAATPTSTSGGKRSGSKLGSCTIVIVGAVLNLLSSCM